MQHFFSYRPAPFRVFYFIRVSIFSRYVAPIVDVLWSRWATMDVQSIIDRECQATARIGQLQPDATTLDADNVADAVSVDV